MKSTYARLTVSLIALFVAVTTAYAGGWAIITVKDFPDYAVTGKPLTLIFTVRQHGVTLMEGLKPSVRFKTPFSQESKSAATPTANKGEYSADLNLAQAGEWTIVIDSGFNAIATTLPPLKVIPSGTPSPMPLSETTRGDRLYTAKGCNGCHAYQGVGPDLTTKHFSEDYLKRFLADPAGTLKRPAKPEYGQMPNLNLKQEEIAALATFLITKGD